MRIKKIQFYIVGVIILPTISNRATLYMLYLEKTSFNILFSIIGYLLHLLEKCPFTFILFSIFSDILFNTLLLEDTKIEEKCKLFVLSAKSQTK